MELSDIGLYAGVAAGIVLIVVLVRYAILLDDALIENFKSKASERGY
jgi:hypothetical protein